MADNTTLDPGTGGDVIATDDITGVHYQRTKLTDGTADSTTVVAAGGGVEANALRVTVASDSTGVLSVDDNGASLTVDVGTARPAGTNNIGDVDIASALPAGTNNIGDVDVASIATGSNVIGQVGLEPRTSGGLTIGPGSGAKQISAASTNATSVKASAGQVYGWYIYNDGAAEAYFKIYDKASAPTVGTDVPDLVLAIPAGAAANCSFEMGIPFGTGIATAITTGAADSDTGAVAANQVVSNLFFK